MNAPPILSSRLAEKKERGRDAKLVPLGTPGVRKKRAPNEGHIAACLDPVLAAVRHGTAPVCCPYLLAVPYAEGSLALAPLAACRTTGFRGVEDAAPYDKNEPPCGHTVGEGLAPPGRTIPPNPHRLRRIRAKKNKPGRLCMAQPPRYFIFSCVQPFFSHSLPVTLNSMGYTPMATKITTV